MNMKDGAIERELADLSLRFHGLRSELDEGGGGSPGEWMVERMCELETEQKRRANGGAIDRTVPLQSK
jgi:hypothetical protein